MHPTPQALLHGRYLVLSETDDGVGGTLLRARDLVHERDVALVVVRPPTDSARRAWAASTRRLLRLPPHPALAQLREDFEEAGVLHRVFDWIAGPTLSQAMAAPNGTAPSSAQRLTWVRQVAAALTDLHGGGEPAAHGDLRPDTVIIAGPESVVLVGLTGQPLTARRRRADLDALARLAVTCLGPPGTVSAALGVDADGHHQEAALPASTSADAGCTTPLGVIAPWLALTHASNTPRYASAFVGRGTEMATLATWLRSERLVTIAGPAGSGKTRLACQVAGAVLHDWPGGHTFVDLRGMADGQPIVPTIGTLLGLHEEGAGTLADRLLARLRSPRTLLILDGCDQHLASVAALAERLLSQTPEAAVLVTSREPLHAWGERMLRLEPFPTDADARPVGTLRTRDAVRLLSLCMCDGLPADRRSAPAVRRLARIASALDGLPLALEIAGPLIALDASPSLDGATVEASCRGIAIRLDLSHPLLGDAERSLLRRLSVFTGAFELAAVDAVCADAGGAEAVLQSLAALVDRSWVISLPGTHHCYRLLGPVREYATGRLAAAGEAEVMRDRLHAWRSRAPRPGPQVRPVG